VRALHHCVDCRTEIGTAHDLFGVFLGALVYLGHHCWSNSGASWQPNTQRSERGDFGFFHRLVLDDVCKRDADGLGHGRHVEGVFILLFLLKISDPKRLGQSLEGQCEGHAFSHGLGLRLGGSIQDGSDGNRLFGYKVQIVAASATAATTMIRDGLGNGAERVQSQSTNAFLRAQLLNDQGDQFRGKTGKVDLDHRRHVSQRRHGHVGLATQDPYECGDEHIAYVIYRQSREQPTEGEKGLA